MYCDNYNLFTYRSKILTENVREIMIKIILYMKKLQANLNIVIAHVACCNIVPIIYDIMKLYESLTQNYLTSFGTLM